MKTNTKRYGMMALLGVLIVGIILISGCVDDSEKEYATEQPAEEHAPAPIIDKGLVADYSFDGDTKDHSENGNHATNHGATFVSGIKGKALDFDGVDFVSAPVNINPDVMPQMTMAVWVKPDDGSPIRQVISHDDGGYGRSLGIDRRGGGTGWSAFCGSGSVLGYCPVEVGKWTFIAAVYDQDAGTVKLYVNGAIYKKEGTLGAGQERICIGANPSFMEYFSGVIDEVKIYNRALSADELKSLYETGSARPITTPTPTSTSTPTTEQTTEEPVGEPSVVPSDWCPEGTVNPIEKSKITGIEKHTINGKTMNLCCKEMSPDGEKVMKTCISKDAMYFVTFMYDETGKRYKSKEIYPEGDKVCSRLFSRDGTVIMERCVKMD